MGYTLEQVTWQEPGDQPDDEEDDFILYLDPDGIGGDGLGPDESPEYENFKYLDGGRAMMLVSFASALDQMQCHFEKAENKTIQSRKLYSYSHAYMLHWYQYNSNDSRIFSDGLHHYASEEDLQKILQELFNGLDAQTAKGDVEYFCEKYALGRGSGEVMMEAVGDYGDAGRFYLEDPYDVQLAGDRILLMGNVVEYSSASQASG